LIWKVGCILMDTFLIFLLYRWAMCPKLTSIWPLLVLWSNVLIMPHSRLWFFNYPLICKLKFNIVRLVLISLWGFNASQWLQIKYFGVIHLLRNAILAIHKIEFWSFKLQVQHTFECWPYGGRADSSKWGLKF